MDKRDLSFDFIKGILIILVCWGHAIQVYMKEGCVVDDTFQIIYSFHMPLFILLSGYFSLRTVHQGIRDVVVSRWKRLLVPAFFWIFISLIINLLRGKALNLHDFGDIIHGAWFLFCLYVLAILSSVIWGYKYKYLWAIIICAFLYLLYPYWPIGLKHFVYYLQLTRMWPVFVVGLFLNEKQILKRLGKREKILVFVTCLFVYVIYIYSGIIKDDPIWLHPNMYFVKGLAIYAATIVWLFLLRGLYRCTDKFILTKHLCAAGNSTLGIYMFHGFLWPLMPSLGEGWYVLLLLGIVSFLVSWLIVDQVFRKIRITKVLLLGEK